MSTGAPTQDSPRWALSLGGRTVMMAPDPHPGFDMEAPLHHRPCRCPVKRLAALLFIDTYSSASSWSLSPYRTLSSPPPIVMHLPSPS